jgi:Asp-tRNA(Asn)/Glu-tRNA(Gln) amidotransferase A subunit family amidase
VPATCRVDPHEKSVVIELTKMYLDRLKKYGPKLLCVVTLTEELAMKQAQAADDDLKARRNIAARCMAFLGR